MQAAIPLMVLGSLVQGVGGMQAANANAKIAKQNAHQELVEGAMEAQRIREAARAAMGRQVAAQAESGFVPGTGSALDSLEESAIQAEMDIMNVRRKAALGARAYMTQAAMDKAQGRMALVGGLFGAANAVAGHKADYAQLNNGYGVRA